MKHWLSLLLLTISIMACAESAKEKNVEQPLYSSFLDAYRPLESCLNEQLGGIVTNESASAIVKAGKLDELKLGARNLLPPDNPKLLLAVKEPDAEKQAFALLDALVGYRFDRIKQKIEFDSYGLLREVVPAMSLAEIESVGCKKPKYLEYWAREADRLDIYLNLAMEAERFWACVKPNNDWHTAIFEAKRINELDALAYRVLGNENSQLNAFKTMEDSPQKAASYINLIAQYATLDNNFRESVEIRFRKLLGLSGIKMIYSDVKGLSCKLPEPNWHAVAWKYIEDHPFDANPSPFTTNNKVDTP